MQQTHTTHEAPTPDEIRAQTRQIVDDAQTRAIVPQRERYDSDSYDQSPAHVTFSPEQIALLKRTIANRATDDELQLFLWTSKRLGLDPFAGQIRFIKRKSWDPDAKEYVEKATITVAIDGFRLVAARTGRYEGQTAPEWCEVTIDENGKPTITWFPIWPYSGRTPHGCRIGVYRTGFRGPLYAVARFDAYKQTKSGGNLNSMWERMGAEQLAKCVEALALRKAFPNELSGVYTDDEMAQSFRDDDPPAAAQQQQTPKTRTQGGTRQAKARIDGVEIDAKWTEREDVDRRLVGTYKIDSARLEEMGLTLLNRIDRTDSDEERERSRRLLAHVEGEIARRKQEERPESVRMVDEAEVPEEAGEDPAAREGRTREPGEEG